MADLQKEQTTKLKMSIKCQQLNKICYKETISPYLVVSSRKFDKKPQIFHKSKVVLNNFSPQFDETVFIEQSFEDNQTFIFQVFNYGFDIPIGQMKLTATEVIKAIKGRAVKQLDTGFKKGGKMIVDISLTNPKKHLIYLKIRGQQLQAKTWLGWFGAKFLFIKLVKIQGNSAQSLYISEEMPYNKNIQWKQFCIQKFQTDDKSKIQILLCSKKNQKEQNIIAKNEIAWTDLQKLGSIDVLDNQKHRYAKIQIKNYRMEIDNTFNEFVQAGMNINLMIGVDFSASMLPASHFDSPHYVGNGSSLYEKALIHLSSLMLQYTNKRKASVYAIGAKIKHPKNYTGEKIQQCFPINADFQNEQIQGIQKIRQQYRTVLNYITFSGPTDITVIIKKAIQKSIQSKKNRQQYTVLVILSDGKITNTKQVQEILKQCATLSIYVAFLVIGSNDQNLKDLTSVRMQVISAQNTLVLRQNLVNVGCYLGKGDNLCDSIKDIMKKLPYVVSKYMSLKKKSPQSLSIKIMKLKQKSNSEK